MGTTTLSPKVAAATLSSASAYAGNRNLSTDPKRRAVIKARNSMMRGARQYCEEQGFLTIHNMPHTVGVTGACENTDTLFTLNWYDGKKMFLPQANQLYIEMGRKIEDFEWYFSFHEEHDVQLHAGAGVGMARVAQFILAQEDVRECVPFLINRNNVI